MWQAKFVSLHKTSESFFHIYISFCYIIYSFIYLYLCILISSQSLRWPWQKRDFSPFIMLSGLLPRMIQRFCLRNSLFVHISIRVAIPIFASQLSLCLPVDFGVYEHFDCQRLFCDSQSYVNLSCNSSVSTNLWVELHEIHGAFPLQKKN